MKEEGNNLLVYLKNGAAFLLLFTIFTFNLQWILQLKLQLMESHIHSSLNSISQALFWSLTANLISYSHFTCLRPPPRCACASIDPAKWGPERGLPRYQCGTVLTAGVSNTLARRKTTLPPCHAMPWPPHSHGAPALPRQTAPASLSCSFFHVKTAKHGGLNDSRVSQHMDADLQSGLRQVNGFFCFYPSLTGKARRAPAPRQVSDAFHPASTARLRGPASHPLRPSGPYHPSPTAFRKITSPASICNSIYSW